MLDLEETLSSRLKKIQAAWLPLLQTFDCDGFGFHRLGDDGNILSYYQRGVDILKVHQILLLNGGHPLGLLEYGLTASLYGASSKKKAASLMASTLRLSISFVNFMSGGLASRAISLIEEGVVKCETETDKLDGWWTMLDRRSGGEKNRRLGFWIFDG